MEEKELTPNEIRGINLIVKALQKKYNFITGWNVEDDYMKYDNTLFISLDIDMDKVSDYYGFRVRPTIKRLMDDREPEWYGRDISNPTVFLDLPDNNDEGYQSKKHMSEISNTLYKQLPEKLQRTYQYNAFDGLQNYPVVINIISFRAY
jgi:chromosome condensin MukBEF complex kleisin-like MukF subunit